MGLDAILTGRYRTQMLSRILIATVLTVALAPVAEATRPWITADKFDRLHVVVGIGASEPDYWAAGRVRQHWTTATGFEVSIDRHPRPGAVNVWVGSANNPFLSLLNLEGLSSEGYVLRTVAAKQLRRFERFPGELAGKHLVMAGGGPRGTLYAELEFMETMLGARVLVPEQIAWPPPPLALPEINIRREPAFAYRDISYRNFLRLPWFSHAHRLNGHWSGVPDHWGGHTRYVRGDEGFGHTFHYFVDPEEYFDAHPEYFAEIDGERVKYAQLCLTNETVLAITIAKARALLREAAPNERILSISQMDYHWFDSWCTCANCKAIDDRERSHSGSILHFVNQVADAVADEYPDARIDTFAYLYSRKPPRRLKPHPNVIVRLCAIECDYSRPISDRSSPRNRAFARDLKKWSRIAPTLFVWDYTQNWYSFQAPHPNLHILQPNLAFYAKHGVDGVFEQASPRHSNSDFEMLKGYLLARSLWNPNLDWEPLYEDFLRTYYQDAAPFVDEYLKLITDRVRQDEVVMTFENSVGWMDAALVEQAQAIFASAFAAVRDEVVLERLEHAYVHVQYAALVCPPLVHADEEAYVLTRPPSQSFEEYWDMLRAYGVRYLNDYPIQDFWDRLEGTTPLRYERLPIEKIANGRLELWVVPDRGGAAVRMIDRVTGRDWLTGHEDILNVRGRFQEWIASDAGEFDALEKRFEVVDQGSDYIVLGVALENGLALERELRLAPDSTAVDVRIRITNEAEVALEPVVELDPELSAEGMGKAQLWVERAGVWAKEPLRGEDGFYRDRLAGSEVTRWAFRFPTVGETIVSTVQSEAVETLTYRHRRDTYASMAQTMDTSPLAPGESRELRMRLEFTPRKPAAF